MATELPLGLVLALLVAAIPPHTDERSPDDEIWGSEGQDTVGGPGHPSDDLLLDSDAADTGDTGILTDTGSLDVPGPAPPTPPPSRL